MCATCCYLRGHIRNFEEGFLLREGRLPNPGELAPIDKMRTQYRDIKRGARDYAATRIQVTMACRLSLRTVQKDDATLSCAAGT